MARMSTGSRRSATSSTAGDAMARLMLPLGLYPGPLARRTEHTLLRLLNAALRRHVWGIFAGPEAAPGHRRLRRDGRAPRRQGAPPPVKFEDIEPMTNARKTSILIVDDDTELLQRWLSNSRCTRNSTPCRWIPERPGSTRPRMAISILSSWTWGFPTSMVATRCDCCARTVSEGRSSCSTGHDLGRRHHSRAGIRRERLCDEAVSLSGAPCAHPRPTASARGECGCQVHDRALHLPTASSFS